MGTSSYVTCPICRKTYRCGYGSYSSHDCRVGWQMWRHDGHDAVDWQSDWAWIEGDDLVWQSFDGYDVWVPGAAKFEQIDDTGG